MCYFYFIEWNESSKFISLWLELYLGGLLIEEMVKYYVIIEFFWIKFIKFVFLGLWNLGSLNWNVLNSNFKMIYFYKLYFVCYLCNRSWWVIFYYF